jgi:hypothetical protein
MVFGVYNGSQCMRWPSKCTAAGRSAATPHHCVGRSPISWRCRGRVLVSIRMDLDSLLMCLRPALANSPTSAAANVPEHTVPPGQRALDFAKQMEVRRRNNREIIWMRETLQRVVPGKVLSHPWVASGCFLNVHSQFSPACTPPSREEFLNQRNQLSIDEL